MHKLLTRRIARSDDNDIFGQIATVKPTVDNELFEHTHSATRIHFVEEDAKFDVAMAGRVKLLSSLLQPEAKLDDWCKVCLDGGRCECSVHIELMKSPADRAAP